MLVLTGPDFATVVRTVEGVVLVEETTAELVFTVTLVVAETDLDVSGTEVETLTFGSVFSVSVLETGALDGDSGLVSLFNPVFDGFESELFTFCAAFRSFKLPFFE